MFAMVAGPPTADWNFSFYYRNALVVLNLNEHRSAKDGVDRRCVFLIDRRDPLTG
jgi:hypothetical protein